MNCELPSVVIVGGSVPNEEISGVAVDLDGPVTPEKAAVLQEIRAFLLSENPFNDPSSSENQSSGKVTIW